MLAVLALGQAGCALDLEGSIPDAEVTRHDIQLPAAPAAIPGLDPRVVVSYQQRPPRLSLPREAFTEVLALGVTISAKSGVADLSFIRTARVLLAVESTAGGDATPIEIGRYERVDGAAVGTTIFLTAEPPADVLPAWKNSLLSFTFEVTGELPTVPWTADVGVRFSAKLEQ